MKDFKVHHKKIFLQMLSLNHFFCEEMCFESLLNNDIQMPFHLNYLKCDIFILMHVYTFEKLQE
jgi:hypothetical protein